MSIKRVLSKDGQSSYYVDEHKKSFKIILNMLKEKYGVDLVHNRFLILQVHFHKNSKYSFQNAREIFKLMKNHIFFEKKWLLNINFKKIIGRSGTNSFNETKGT